MSLSPPTLPAAPDPARSDAAHTATALLPAPWPASDAVTDQLPRIAMQPVFVDATGRRQRRLQRTGALVGAACLTCLVALAVAVGAGGVDPVTIGLPAAADPTTEAATTTATATSTSRATSRANPVPTTRASRSTAAPVPAVVPVTSVPPTVPTPVAPTTVLPSTTGAPPATETATATPTPTTEASEASEAPTTVTDVPADTEAGSDGP